MADMILERVAALEHAVLSESGGFCRNVPQIGFPVRAQSVQVHCQVVDSCAHLHSPPCLLTVGPGRDPAKGASCA